MNQITSHEYYESNLKHYTEILHKAQKKISTIVLLRLLVFISGLVIITLIIRIHGLNFLVLSIPFIGLFLFLIKKHENLKYRKKYVENCLTINRQELNALSGDQSVFEDGSVYIDPSHPYTSDMDVFGKNSLFQYLNRTVTSGGKDMLAQWLKQKSSDTELLLRQLSLQELGQKSDLRLDFQATGMINGEDRKDREEIQAWIKEDNYFYGKALFHKLSVIFPLLVLISLLLSFFVIPPSIFFLFFTMQLGYVAIYLKKINRLHTKISRKHDLIKQFGNLIQKIEHGNFTSTRLIQLKSATFNEIRSSSKQIRKLSELIRLFDNRLNVLAGIFLNGLFMLDIQCLLKLEKWKTINRNNLENWLNVVAEFDGLVSLANFHFNHPDFIFPYISNQKQTYQFTQLGLPLIPLNERVSNDLHINGEGSMLIITGSNMAGKSTFLRTIGINLILAMAAAPVCAKDFIFYPVQLYSSMRISDDLANRESTFYAELKRLKQIIVEVEKKELFILLDEILKGTNSTDKLTGSISLLRELAKSDAVGLIATHDLALGALEKELPGKVWNYNFEVEIRNNEFYFDYKLKTGICKVLNATELMKKMGLKV